MTTEKLSIKRKIVEISKELRGKLKKDGENTYSNYNYFKPDDIQIALSPLLEANNLFKHFTMPFNAEKQKYEGKLRIEDIDDDKQFIEWQLDIPLAQLTASSEAQGAGATQTYCQRYLIMNAFSIADNNDDLDAKNPKVFLKPETKLEKTNTPHNVSDTKQCPNCGGQMVLREKNGSKFWGCRNYKERGCKTIPHEDEPSFETKLRQAHREADMQKKYNDSIPVINDDAEYGVGN